MKTLILVIAINTIFTGTILDECENVALYNNSGTKNNALDQTKYSTFAKALKNAEEIGKGNFGKVYKMDFYETKKSEKIEIGVKVIETYQIKESDNFEQKSQTVYTEGNEDYSYLLEQEITYMKILSRNEKFVNFYGCKYEKNPRYNSEIEEQYKKLDKEYLEPEYVVYLLMEAFTSDLAKSRKYFQLLDKNLRIDFYVSLLEDIKYLHEEKKLSHNDIKPENIMMTQILYYKKDKKFYYNQKNKLKIIDYGLMTGLEQEFFGGSPLYMHPDYFKIDEEIEVREEYDIYSLAITILYLEISDPRKILLDDSCYERERYDIKICFENLHKLILEEFDLNYRDCFLDNEEIQENIKFQGDDYFYMLLNFEDCKSLGCTLLHLVSERTDDIPHVDIIIQKFMQLSIEIENNNLERII